MSDFEEGEKRRKFLIAAECAKPGFKHRLWAKCIECIYDPWSEGNWRKQVQFCTDKACPIHPVRPKSSAKTELES